jgi:hypothetical protein
MSVGFGRIERVIERLVIPEDLADMPPGPGLAAVLAGIDHIRDWAHGGPTEERNLGTLCRHDHGRTYLVPPEPRPEG